MAYKRSLNYVLLCLSFVPQLALAEFKSRDEIGLSSTDNANLKSANEVGDFYATYKSTNTYEMGAHRLGLKFGYTDYFVQSQNDVFSYRLFDRLSLTGTKTEDSEWALYGALLGQSYPEGGSGVTDQSFNSIGANLRADYSRVVSSQTEITLSPGYLVRSYSDLDERTEHTYSVTADVNYQHTPDTTLSANAEVGVVRSSMTDYNAAYGSLGGGFEYILGDGWSWLGDLTLTKTNFDDRTASTITASGIRRGTLPTRRNDQTESYNRVDLSTQIAKEFSSRFSGHLAVSRTQQTSVSGSQNYRSTDLSAFVRFQF